MLTSGFLDLFATYVQVNLLMSYFDERRLVMATYYKLYYSIKLVNEPNYSKYVCITTFLINSRVANYLVFFDNPIKAMQEEFKSLSASLGKTLVNLVMLYNKLRTVQILRKEGALNITLKPEDMAKPIIDKVQPSTNYLLTLLVSLPNPLLQSIICVDNIRIFIMSRNSCSPRCHGSPEAGSMRWIRCSRVPQCCTKVSYSNSGRPFCLIKIIRPCLRCTKPRILT